MTKTDPRADNRTGLKPEQFVALGLTEGPRIMLASHAYETREAFEMRTRRVHDAVGMGSMRVWYDGIYTVADVLAQWPEAVWQYNYWFLRGKQREKLKPMSLEVKR